MIKRLLHTTSLKANIIANFVGNAWGAIISLIFVPFYLKYIGAEGYGLIGIFTSLQIVLSLLDGGMSTTLNRELSRLGALPQTNGQMRNLVKSLGTVYWGVAIFAGLLALGMSPLLAKYWVHSKELSPQTIMYALSLLSISLLFQFPAGFYSGGLMGLQRQVVLNVLRIFFASLRSAGALIVLMYVSSSILSFFIWIAFVSFLQAFVFKYCLWYFLPKASSPAIFDKLELKKIWKFAASLTGIGITSILLTQVDSVILSKILPLDKFGYYSLAFTLGSISYSLVGPISQSYFPKFSALIATNDQEKLKGLYHQGCQFVTLIVVPFALFFALFSKEILMLWTKSEVTTANTWQMTSVIAIAVALHCLMFIPYMLCLANSYTRLAFYTNIVILIVLIPTTVFAALHYGGLGGACCWLMINLIYFAVSPVLIHKKILKGEAFNWYWNDTVKASAAALFILLIFRFAINLKNFNTQQTVLILMISGIFSFVAALLLLKQMREGALQNFKILKTRLNGK